MKRCRCLKIVMLPALTAAAIAASGTTLAAENATSTDIQNLQQQIDQLKQQIKLNEQKTSAANHKAEAANTAAMAAENADIKWRVTGSVVANYMNSDMKGAPNTYTGGSFMPIFLVRYKDLLELESHLEFANNGSETESSLEYSQLDIFATDWATIVAGKFLSPMGQFQQSFHPPWINKLPDRPAGFAEDGGAEPLSDVGVQVRGAVGLTQNASINYAVYSGNGPQLTSDGLSLEGFSQDNNSNKALGGRVGLRLLPYINVGMSGMEATVNGLDDAATSADYSMFGADFSVIAGALDVKGEVIDSKLTSAYISNTQQVPETRWNLWYAQAAYRLSGITDNVIVGNVEPVIRYGRFRIKGGADDWHTNAERRTTVGVDYWFGPTMVAKLAAERRLYDNKPDINVYRVQVAFGF